MDHDVFASVHRLEHSKEPAARTLCAVLAAATEVIRDRGAESNPVAYLGVFLSGLQKHRDQPVETTAALAHLLVLVLPVVPASVVRSQAETIINLFRSIFEQHGSDSVVARHGLACVAVVLRVADAATWQRPPAQHMFHVLASEALDRRPRVRRTALASVSDAMRNLHGLAKKRAAQIVCDIVQHALQQRDSDMKNVFHGLGLLRYVLPQLPRSSADAMLAQLVTLLTTTNDILLSTVYLTLDAAVFEKDELDAPDVDEQARGGGGGGAAAAAAAAVAAGPPAGGGSDAGTFLSAHPAGAGSHASPAAVASALSAVLAHPPPARYPDAVRRCGDFVGHAMTRLHAHSAASAAPFVSAVVTTLLSYLAGEQPVHAPALACSKALHALAPLMRDPTLLAPAIAALSPTLGVSHRNTWRLVLAVAADLLHGFPASALDRAATDTALRAAMTRLLQACDALHGAAPQDALDAAVGAAIAVMGPRFVLTTLPLELFRGSEGVEPRLWLLPLLRRHVRRGELALFSELILPAAQKVAGMAKAAVGAAREADATQLAALLSQLYGVLVGVCHRPVDMATGLPPLVPALISALEDARVRDDVAVALAVLAETSGAAVSGTSHKKTASRTDASDSDNETSDAAAGAGTAALVDAASRTALAAAAAKLLPSLFAVFTATAPGDRENVQRAVRGLARVADAAVASKLFEQALRRLLEATVGEQEASQRRALADLAVAVVDALPAKAAHMLYRAIREQLNDETPALQKQAYKAMRRLLAHPQFATTAAELHEVTQTLIAAAPTCSPAARYGRLRAIHALLPRLEGAALRDAVRPLLADVVFGTKEVAQRTREQAFDTLVDMAKRAAVAGAGEVSPATVMQWVLASLAGATPYMMAGGALALSRLLYEYAADMPVDALRACMQAAQLLLQHRGREVLKAAIGLVKVAVVSLPPPTLAQVGPDLIGALMALPPHHKRHFRVPIRVILERCVRKLGYDAVAACIPEDNMRLLSAIRRAQRRKGRPGDKDHDTGAAAGSSGAAAAGGGKAGYQRALEGSESEDSADGGRRARSDDSDDDSAEDERWAAVAASGGAMEHDAEDLLNPRVAARFSSGHARRAADAAFETAPDGRLMFHEKTAGRDRSHLLQPVVAGKRSRAAAEHSGSDIADDDDADDDMDIAEAADALDFNEPMTHKLKKKMQKDDHDDSASDAEAVAAKPQRKRGATAAAGAGDADSAAAAAAASTAKAAAAAGKKKKAKGAAGKQGRLERLATGADYASKHAAGDVKRAGRPDPFAYVPLNPQALNKRKRHSAHKQFDALVKGAKRGAQKGGRQRRAHK